MYAIVDWIGWNPPCVSIVPSNCLINEDGKLWSYWPSSNADDNIVKKRVVPFVKWPKYEVRILGRAG
jgi:hypothetical protein